MNDEKVLTEVCENCGSETKLRYKMPRGGRGSTSPVNPWRVCYECAQRQADTMWWPDDFVKYTGYVETSSGWNSYTDPELVGLELGKEYELDSVMVYSGTVAVYLTGIKGRFKSEWFEFSRPRQGCEA